MERRTSGQLLCKCSLTRRRGWLGAPVSRPARAALRAAHGTTPPGPDGAGGCRYENADAPAAPASCCVNAAPARRREPLGAPVSDRHRPPPAGEHVLAARSDGATPSASAIRPGGGRWLRPSGPRAGQRPALQACGPSGRVESGSIEHFHARRRAQEDTRMGVSPGGGLQTGTRGAPSRARRKSTRAGRRAQALCRWGCSPRGRLVGARRASSPDNPDSASRFG